MGTDDIDLGAVEATEKRAAAALGLAKGGEGEIALVKFEKMEQILRFAVVRKLIKRPCRAGWRRVCWRASVPICFGGLVFGAAHRVEVGVRAGGFAKGAKTTLQTVACLFAIFRQMLINKFFVAKNQATGELPDSALAQRRFRLWQLSAFRLHASQCSIADASRRAVAPFHPRTFSEQCYAVAREHFFI
jgi:hypothetical protein